MLRSFDNIFPFYDIQIVLNEYIVITFFYQCDAI